MVFTTTTTTTAKKRGKKKNSRLIRPYPSFKLLYFFTHRDSRTFNYHQNFTISPFSFCYKFKLIIYPFPKSFYRENLSILRFDDSSCTRFIISLPRSIVNNSRWKNFVGLFLFFIQSVHGIREMVPSLLLSSTDGPNIKRNGGTQSKIPHVQLNPFVHRRSPPPVFPPVYVNDERFSVAANSLEPASRHARWILIGQHGKDLSPLSRGENAKVMSSTQRHGYIHKEM